KEFLVYPSEAIVSVIIIVAVFYGLFMGTRFMAGAEFEFGERLDQIIIGYVVWSFTIYGLNSIGQEMQHDAQVGALEQVFMSPYSPLRIFAIRTLADLLLNILMTLTVLVSIMLLSGRWLSFSLELLAPLVLIFCSVFAIAFFMGAIALQVKQVTQLAALGQFVLLFTILTPFENFSGLMFYVGYLIPLSPSVAWLRESLTAASSVSTQDMLAAALNTILYCGFSLYLFKNRVAFVKRKGNLAWY
ncbi:MAG: ABC transporter permease, partial [Gammaproteobacteria bacterium]|nr:ABC transporter permease [Gammaproteobacteria bacterium]